jgi:hypothetical protein
LTARQKDRQTGRRDTGRQADEIQADRQTRYRQTVRQEVSRTWADGHILRLLLI